MDVNFGFHGAGFEAEVAGEANDFSGEGAADGIDANLHLIAIVDILDGIFRHGQAEAENAALSNPDDRQRLYVRIVPDWMSAPVSASRQVTTPSNGATTLV